MLYFVRIECYFQYNFYTYTEILFPNNKSYWPLVWILVNVFQLG